MKSRRYGLFRGRVLDRKAEPSGNSPHYHILLDGEGERFRVAINTRSGTSHHREADLLYFADDDFRHPLTRELAGVGDGFLHVPSHAGGLALDYQRGGLFDRHDMRRIPGSRPGPGNDLIDELDARVERAIAEPTMRLVAYGTRWGPEPHQPDQEFGFVPGNGIHDVHMNQGNRDEHWHDNGTWSDGGLLFFDPKQDRWSAVFLAFQTQSWHTNDKGDPIMYPKEGRRGREERREEPGSWVRIAGAFVHPNERKRGVEHVAIRNSGHEPVDVRGWQIRNGDGELVELSGDVPPRTVRRFELPRDAQLSNRGGTIVLMNAAGEEADKVRYTRRDARRKHGSLTF